MATVNPTFLSRDAPVPEFVFQHASVESLLRELRRNPALSQACGFDTLAIQKRPAAQCQRDERSGRLRVYWSSPEAPHYALPDSWNMSRFLTRLIVKWFNLNGHPVKRENSENEVLNDCTKKTQVFVRV